MASRRNFTASQQTPHGDPEEGSFYYKHGKTYITPDAYGASERSSGEAAEIYQDDIDE
jgi:hypothetical protein